MVDYVNKDLFLADSVEKQFRITASNGIILTNSDLIEESIKVVESICSEKQFTLGSAEASKVEFDAVFDSYGGSLEGETITCDIVLNGDEENPFRLFSDLSVYTDKPTAKGNTRHIVAYDALYGINRKDVSAWYDALFPSKDTSVSLGVIRNSFFYEIGIPFETKALPNDAVMVQKNVDIGSIKAKKVLHDILEINGSMGHIDREGIFRFIYMTKPELGLLPREDLLPSENLYPADTTANCIIDTSKIMSGTFSAVESEGITKVVIRNDESSAGTSAGVEGNTCYITTNIFAMGWQTGTAYLVADRILNKVRGLNYTPFDVKTIGNPCSEVGDSALIITDNGAFSSFIFYREMKGLQFLIDTIGSKGERKLIANKSSVEDQFTQVGGKLQALKVTAEEISSDLLDFENETVSNFTQTSEAIRAKVSSTGGTASSFAWSLTDNGFSLISNNKTVFNCTSSDLTLDFSNSGSGGSLTIADGYVFQRGGTGNVQLKNGTVIVTNGLNTGQFNANSVLLQDSNGNATLITPTSATINNSAVATQSWVNSEISDMATKEWVGEQEFASFDWVAEYFQPKGDYLTSGDLNGYATESWVSNNYQPKGNYALSSALDNYILWQEADDGRLDFITENILRARTKTLTIDGQTIKYVEGY